MRKLVCTVVLLLLGVGLALLWPLILRNIRFSGYFKGDRDNVHPGICRNIQGIENGSEDMELLPDGKVLVTSGFRRTPGYTIPADYRGKILLLDLNQSELKPVQVTIIGDLDTGRFNPLGITKWVDKKTGEITVFIVNLPWLPHTSLVEKFTYSLAENTLHHVETIGAGDPNFFELDDLVAVNAEQFYYTNIFGRHWTWEVKYLLALSSVGFHDGGKSILVDDGLAGPNGINMSPDGKFIYVNMFSGQFMRIYERQEDNSLKQIQDYHFPAAVDNIMFDQNGDIWNTGHAIGGVVFDYMADPKGTLSPTEVYHVTIKDGKVTSSVPVFIDDGKLMSGGTVAVPFKNRIIMGSIASKATICDLGNDL